MKLVTFLTSLSIISALVTAITVRERAKFEEFKQQYSKTYDGEEHIIRFHRWKKIKSIIDRQNQNFAKGRQQYFLSENRFADQYPYEWRNNLFGITLPGKSGFNQDNTVKEWNPSAEENNAQGDVSNRQKQPVYSPVDWRNHSCLQPVRNQTPCGACWAFTATTSVEFQTCILNNNITTPRLSEQQLIDCSRSFGTIGCAGGFYTQAWDFIASIGGQTTNWNYPYIAKNGTCKYRNGNTPPLVGKPLKYVALAKFNESNMLRALRQGPVTVSISANTNFIFYSSGIFDDSTCKNGPINHGVVIVGQNIINGTDCWIVRNSWGTSWGQGGYIYMRRNVNICRIAEYAYLATPSTT